MVWPVSHLTRMQRTVLALILATAARAQTPTPVPLPLPTTLPIPTPTSLPIPAPTKLPIPAPTKLPIPTPTSLPIPTPTNLPIPTPTSLPIPVPTKLPIPAPTKLPIPTPTLSPTPVPTYKPTLSPTPVPTYEPSAPSPQPTPPPTPVPTPLPTPLPTIVPSLQPSPVPTPTPTPLPTPAPTSTPTPVPSNQPTPLPSPVPTLEPTPAPTLIPTPAPTPLPSPVPTPVPTLMPTPAPTPIPSPVPTPAPTPLPTPVPSPVPSLIPTPVPTLSPTPVPTPLPTKFPTPSPTPAPTSVPTYLPSRQPSRAPSSLPTLPPSGLPTLPPTPLPSTSFPSSAPTMTNNPTPSPTPRPSHTPTSLPTPRPTRTPTLHPTPYPTKPPTPSPTRTPSLPPTRRPTPQPSLPPTPKPTTLPSPRPTHAPTLPPTDRPTPLPSEQPSPSPSATPSSVPTLQPTTKDTSRVTVIVVITASSELPTAADQASIESAAATAVGVETSAVRNFAVSSTALNRRLDNRHPAAQLTNKKYHRQLTTSWSWDISFVVEGQLTAVGAATAADWASTVNTALTDGTFATAVVASVASADAVSTPSTQVNTRTPSSLPTEVPTPNPTPVPTPVPTDSPPPTPAPSTRPNKFIWKPDNISIAISARHTGPYRLSELNTDAAAAFDASVSDNKAPRFGPLSNAAEAGNVTLVLSAAHKVLPAEHPGWGHWALSLNNGTEMTRCLDWHATEDQIEAALNVLPSVVAQSALSGSGDRVVVRRSGGGAGSEGGYGYTIQLSMRSPNGSAWLASPSAGVKVRRSSVVAMNDWAPAASESLKQQQQARRQKGDDGSGADYVLRSGYGDGTHPLNGGPNAQFAVPCDPVWTWGEWDDPSQWTYDESGGSRSATQAPGATVVRTAAATAAADADHVENDDDNASDANDSGWHAGGRAGPGGVVVADEDQEKALDMVLIPRGSGFVQLGRSVAVRGLEMRGGTLATMHSGCPSGWAKPSQVSSPSSSSSSSDGVADRQTKCYAAFRGPPAYAAGATSDRGGGSAGDGPYGSGYGFGRSEADFSPAGGYDQSRGLSRANAEATCAAIAPGAAGYLVRIESLAENELVRGLCQGLAWRPRESGPGDARADLAGRAGGDGSGGRGSIGGRKSAGGGGGTMHGSDEAGNHQGDGSGRSAGVRGDFTAAVLGDDGSPAISQARDPTCWIGLALEQKPGWSGAGKGYGNGAASRRDSLNAQNRQGGSSASHHGASGEHQQGYWRWPDEHEVSDVTWRAWARGEPDNATSEMGGEACAAMGPSLYSIERQHMGLWHDERCSNRFAFVCERFAVSVGHTLVVGPKGFDWRGGAVTGGGTLQVLGPTAVHAGFGGGYRSGDGGGDFDVSSSRWASSRDDDYDDDDNSGSGEGWSSGSGWAVGGLSAGGGWIQRHGVMGPSIGDGASVEAWGGAAFQANAVVEGGDGASFNVLSADSAPGSDSSSASSFSSSSSSLGSDYGADFYGRLPSGSPWALWRLLDNYDDDYASSMSSWPDWATAAGHGLMNSTGRGLLTLGANVTLRTTRGEHAPWEAPPPPPTEGHSEASRIAIAARAKRSSALGRQARARSMSVAVPSTEPLELSPLRGVSVDGSGHVRVALPVAGSGRRPKLVNRGVVLFAPDYAATGGGGNSSASSSSSSSNYTSNEESHWQGGPALVEWFYEASGTGEGSTVSGLGASLQHRNAVFNFTHASANRTGTLVVSSTTHSLVLAGGGLATGGAALVVASGMLSEEEDDSSSRYFGGSISSNDVDDETGLDHTVGVVLANYSMVLAAPPTFLLRVSAERQVVDEERSASTVADDLSAQRYDRSRYSNGGSGYNQYPDPTGGLPKRHYGVNGTYRLAVRIPATSAAASSTVSSHTEEPWDETVCLPYHASADEVEAALESLPVVQALGGLTITRDGHEGDPRWGFGYAYRVVFDAAEARANGGLRGPPRTAGGDASGRSGSGTTRGAWAWDLQGGIMRPGPSTAAAAAAAAAAKFASGYATTASVNGSSTDAARVYDPQSPAHGDGASLWIACQGSSTACGCSEVLANLPMTSGGPATRHGCRHAHNSSLENPNQCTITPRLTVALLHSGGEAWIGDGVARVDQYSTRNRDNSNNASQPSAMPTSKPTTANEYSNDDDDDNYNNSSSSHSNSNNGTKWIAPPAITVVGGAHRLPSALGGGVGLSVWSGEAHVLTSNFSAAFVAIGRPNVSSSAAAGAVGASLDSALFGSPYGSRALDGSVAYQGSADWNEDGWADGAYSSQARRSGGANGTFGLAAYGGGLGGGGLLVCGGAGFVGLDSAQLLYEPGDRKGRSSLKPSVFFGSVRGGLAIGHGGELRIATNNHAASGFTARKVALSSGALLSGWATTTATRSLVIDGHGPKRLRTAAKLVCGVHCEGAWRSSGPVWLSEGAAILNRGRLVLTSRAPEDNGWFDSRGHGYRASGWEYGGVGYGGSGTGNDTASSSFMPNHLFQAYGAGNGYGGGSDGYGGGGRMGVPTLGDVDMGYAASRQGWAPGEQWVEESERKQHPYEDLQRSASSFSGRWYTNPVCGPHCARAPFLINTLTGTIVVKGGGRPRIGLFVRQLGVVEVAVGSRLTLSGGGDGDGTWNVGGNLRISGGTFLMDGSATILTGLNTNVTINNTEAPTLAPTMAPSTAAFLFNNSNHTVNASTTKSSNYAALPTMTHTFINASSSATSDTYEIIVMVNGSVEVTGGGAHQLADVFDGPRLVILGGKVEVRSRYHDLKGGLTVHDGELAYTVATARVFWGRGGANSEESAALHALQGGGNRALLVQDRDADSPNVTFTGGTIYFVEVLPLAAAHPTHFHNGVKNADRTFVTCAAELHWSGGTLRGNAEVGARTGLRLGEARSPLAVATPWANGESAFADQTQGRSATEAAARLAGAQSLNAATGSSMGGVGSEHYKAAHTGESPTAQLPLYARPPMRLEALLTLVSYGRTRWFEGDVTTAGGASLVEAGVVWMENPGGHTARVLVEPVPGSEARRASLVSVWEDNEASMHQDFGGFA